MYDWRWQVRSRIEDVNIDSINAAAGEVEEIRKVGEVYRWAVSPYFYLMDPETRAPHHAPVTSVIGAFGQ